MTVEAQGMWICWFGALKFYQNWIKHKKRRKNMSVFAVFEHFWRFFNFGRILAHQTTKFPFLEVYCFFWHPTHLRMWLSSAWKKIWPYLAEWYVALPLKRESSISKFGNKSFMISPPSHSLYRRKKLIKLNLLTFSPLLEQPSEIDSLYCGQNSPPSLQHK